MSQNQPDRDDIDAEFERLMASNLNGNELSELADEFDDLDASPSSSDAADDFLRSLTDPLAQDQAQPKQRAIVATTFASAEQLAEVVRAIHAQPEISARVPASVRCVQTDTGALLVAPISEAEAHALVEPLSKLVPQLPMLLLWRGEDQMLAMRYQAGESQDKISPALVLGGLSDVVEDLLLTFKPLADLPKGQVFNPFQADEQ